MKYHRCKHYTKTLCLVIICVLAVKILLNNGHKTNINPFSKTEWAEVIKYGVEQGGRLPSIRNDTYTILQWTKTSYGKKNKLIWQGQKSFEMCEFKNCYATYDKAMYNESDAILFGMRNLDGFPQHRFPNQKWIMYLMEPPFNVENFSKYNGLFNTTWTYNRESDIWTNYSQMNGKRGLFVKKPVGLSKLVDQNYTLGKSKMAAWLVSRCQAKSKRLQYVSHLQKYITVDIYGR